MQLAAWTARTNWSKMAITRLNKRTCMTGRLPPDATLDVFALARAAGLSKAVEQFPHCVADAARAAAQDRNDMPEIDGASEPWPPMSVGSGR
jgi:hypothetical protein